MATAYLDMLLKGYRSYDTPEEFMVACHGYFTWAADTPLLEELVFHSAGEITRADAAKKRVYTKSGLTSFLCIPESRLSTYKERGGMWADAVEMIGQVIYTQKFEGAVAGFFNAGIITRDLGLADKQEIGGIANAPPVSFNIEPVQAGTFLAPDSEDNTETVT